MTACRALACRPDRAWLRKASKAEREPLGASKVVG